MKKILHVWDQAGVACIIAKYQAKLFGYETQVIKRKGFDKFGIFSYYQGKEFKAFLGMQFLKTAEKMAKNYDVIHIHDLFELVPRIKKKYDNKKIILHYHGSRLRNTPIEKRSKFEKDADLILVSTPDLIKYDCGEYLPNPVDTELFNHRKIESNNKALSFLTHAETPEFIDNVLKKQNISLKYETKSRDTAPIKYEKIPEFLQKYEYLIDIKKVDGEVGKGRSTLGLQALSLGLKVLDHTFEITQGLPDKHYPENVVKNLEEKMEKK